MLQRLGVRGKLLAVVMVPVLVLLGTIAYIGAGALGDYRASVNTERLVETLGAVREARAYLQAERAESLAFVDIVTDTSPKLDRARDEVSTRYATLDAAAERSGDTRAQAVVDDVAAALGGTGTEMLAGPRAVQVEEPAREGEWLIFPSSDQISAMSADYEEAVAALDAIASEAPDAVRSSVAALAVAVETEAELARTLLADPQEPQGELAVITTQVDRGLDGVRDAADLVAETGETEAALAALGAVDQLEDGIVEIRVGVKSATASTDAVTRTYSAAITSLVAAGDAIAISVPGREVVASMQAYTAIDQLIEALLYEGDVFAGLIRRGTADATEVAQARSIAERTRIALEDAQLAGRGMVPPIVVPELGASESEAGRSFTAIQDGVLTGLDSVLVGAQSADWPALVQQEVDQYAPLRDQAWQATADGAAGATVNARNVAIITLAVAAIAIAVTLIVAFAIARRIVDPLRRLTTTATAVREELPRLVERVAIPGEDVDVSEVQIPVESRDEVGRLAEAFNGVNAATLEIAREQAALRGSISEMFVNVARRDQVLLNRQLSSIDEMERTEDDPNRLTKLFALDHLATRMRRNSESLLVLAGIETGRRLRRPMPLSDVIRTASSEIELYERIDLELNVDPAMLGHHALAAAHLFAELLENATVFSDPGSRVVVRTGRIDHDFTIEVLDNGIGMTPEELVEANARVRSTAASEILGAQRLGLFVVGRIAKRLGAEVAIASEDGRGTVATVLLPASLFATAAEPAPEQAAPAPVAQPDPDRTLATSGLPRRGAAAVPPVPAEPLAPSEQDDAIPMPALIDDEALAAATLVDEDDSIPLPPEVLALMGGHDDADTGDVEAAEAPADAVAESEAAPGSGLPSRKRRAEAAPVDQEEQAVIGLPVRATADQLSALDAESSAFNPQVAASEVAPQTPEERAAVFRGFHSRRDGEGGAAATAPAEPAPETAWTVADAVMSPALEPDDETPAAWGIAEAAEETEAAADPSAADDAAVEAATPALESDDAAATAVASDDEETVAVDSVGTQMIEESEQAPAPSAAALGGAFAALDAIRRATAERQPEAPAEADGADGADVADVADVADGADEDAQSEVVDPPAPAAPTFAVPKLPVGDQSDSPLARSPYGAVFAQRPADDAVVDAAVESAVESAVEVEAEAEVVDGAVDGESPVEIDVESGSFAIPTLEADDAPVADNAPVVDDAPVGDAEITADVPTVDQVDSSTEAVAPVPEAASAEPWMSPLAGFDSAALGDAIADFRPAEQASVESEVEESGVEEPAEERSFEPAPEAGVDAVALDDSIYSYQPAVPEPATESHDLDELTAQASGEEAGRSGFFGRLFGRGKRDSEEPPAPLPMSRPAFAPTDYDPLEEPARPLAAPASFSPEPDQAPEAWPEAPPAPEPAAAAAAVPHPSESERESAPAAFAPGEFTPQALADTPEWESAGESALAAAGHDFAPGTYQPVIDTEHASGRWSDDDEDVTRAAFSEFSSLTSSRPKVEKTDSGLQKRKRPEEKPAEPQPIEDEVTLTPKERDAEAVRNRFSSFYSGTQRARQDAAELNYRSTPQPANE